MYKRQVKQVGLASVLIRMQGHEQPVEGTDSDTARIKLRVALARDVEPMPPAVAAPSKAEESRAVCFSWAIFSICDFSFIFRGFYK